MTDMNKEVIFRDGWTLDCGLVTERIAACAFDAIKLGYDYGLKLNRVGYDLEMIRFEWCGTKQQLTDWYTYVSINMMDETEEERNKVLQVIANK